MSERWIDALHIQGGSEEEREDVREAFGSKPIPETIGVVEMEKTEGERRAIDATRGALNELLGDTGLPEFEYSEDRIHVLDPEEFKRMVEENGHWAEASGLWANGHVYVQRDESEPKFLWHLTHEMSHAASFFAVRMRMEPGENGNTALHLGTKKSGVRFIGERKDRSKKELFKGLNEAFTELVALNIRKRASERCGLDDDARQQMRNVAYEPQVMILDALLRRMAEEKGDPLRARFDRLLADYVTGKSDFLKELGGHRKGAVKILAEMDTTPESALKAAESLGFTEVAEEIRRDFMT